MRPHIDAMGEELPRYTIKRKPVGEEIHDEELGRDLNRRMSMTDVPAEQQSMMSNESLKSDKNPKERLEYPKIVLDRNRKTAFRHFLLFHAIPLTAAIMLIVLNIRTHYYGMDGRWLPALQFAAKAHELFIQLSISAVLVAYLQYLLTRKTPVPFGAIFSTFNITQMSYLWSRAFRGALTTPSFVGFSKIVFALFVPFSILLTTGVGPSSAIAMLPRRVNFTIIDYPIISLNITTQDLYPESFDQPGPPLYTVNKADQHELSPATGWEYLRNLPEIGATQDSKSVIETGLQKNSISKGDGYGMPKLYSLQFHTTKPTWGLDGYKPRTVRRTLYVQYAPNSTFATIQHVPVALSLEYASNTSFHKLVHGPGVSVTDMDTQQAFTSVLCMPNIIINENDTLPIKFPSSFVSGYSFNPILFAEHERHASLNLNPFNFLNFYAISKKKIWDRTMATKEGQIIWVDNIPLSNRTDIAALGAIVVQPERCGERDSYLMTSACVIGARWAKNTISQQRRFNRDIGYVGAVESMLTEESLSTLPEWSKPSIRLSKAWAESLNPTDTEQNRSVADIILRSLPLNDELCPTQSSYNPENSLLWTRPFMHEAILASLVANGMSHIAGVTEQWDYQSWDNNWRVPDSLNTTERPVPPGIVLKFHGHLIGYAWNLDGIPIKIALVILIIYCMQTTLFVVYTFFTGRSSTTWSSIADLVALALNSTPPSEQVLKHTSAGITQTSTFRRLVGVREVVTGEHLEMVFQQKDEQRLPMRRVTIGKAY